MANVFIHGRSPTNQQLSLRCDANGVLLSTVDIAGENGEKLIINQLPLPDSPTIEGSINALNFGLDTETNLAHPISVDEFGLLNVNVISGGGAGSGIIKGANIDGGEGIDISADTKIQSTETINRLYTHSSLYAEYTDGLNQKSDLPLNCDENGLLNVNVVGGDAFDGVIKGISKTAPFPAVSISADASNVEGVITNKLYTRSSIYGINEANQEAQVAVNNGEVSVSVKNASLPVNVSDGVGLPLSSTTQPVGTGTANFLNTYSRMVGTSNGTDYKLALMDAAGRLTTLSNIRDSNGNSVGSQVQTGGTQRGLNVIDVNQSYSNTGIVSGLNTVNYQLPPLGSFGNVANNTTLLTEEETSILTLVGSFYKEKCILSVEDTSITSTGYYIIQASSNGTNYENLGIIQPISYITGKRGNSTILNLSPYTNLKLINGSGDTYNNVKISIYLSK